MPKPVSTALPNSARTTSLRQRRWQRWVESLHIARDAILSNRLRSLLTVFGVVIGVAVVALVAALLESAQGFIADQTAGLGPGIARVEKAAFQDFVGDAQEFEEAKAKRPDVTIENLKTLRDRLGDRLEIGAQVGASLPVRFDNQTVNGVAIQGVTANIPFLSTLKLERGRELSEFDDLYRREVCVIGADVADFLFPAADPIGKTIKLGVFPYEVIGVYAPVGSSIGASQDSFVQMPLGSFAKLFGARSRSIGLLAKAKPGLAMTDDELEETLRFGMRQLRRLQPGEKDNFSITTAKKVQEFAGTITGIAAAVLFPLTAIALIVAGIVVMNMMLASVTERTREIGIRMAIGARRRDILAQFLIESTLLTVVGGSLGLLIATGLAWLFSKLSGLTVGLPLWAAVAALTVAVTVGIVFGVFPARRAARLDPIEALRSE
ncbi:MAG: ABC transporter permease [Acidobacteria bacterium]|nr:ABC transporter permease [Acidobacteriota bacterium]